MSELVDRLCDGEHAVEACVGPESSSAALKECLDRGFVRIKFTETQGGTELGISVDENSIDTSKADFENASGEVTVNGPLTLDFVKVKLTATVDLSNLKGLGHLTKVTD